MSKLEGGKGKKVNLSRGFGWTEEKKLTGRSRRWQGIVFEVFLEWVLGVDLSKASGETFVPVRLIYGRSKGPSRILTVAKLRL